MQSWDVCDSWDNKPSAKELKISYKIVKIKFRCRQNQEWLIEGGELIKMSLALIRQKISYRNLTFANK